MQEFPISGIQHTRAVIALTIAQLCCELYKRDDNPRIDEIQKTINACSKLTKKKKLSAGAKRDIDNAAITLEPYIEKIINANQYNFLMYWEPLFWAALTFVEDVIATCPEYTTGIKIKWEKLQSYMEMLAIDFMIQVQGFDEEGTLIYQKAAWALEGVNFKEDEAA